MIIREYFLEKLFGCMKKLGPFKEEITEDFYIKPSAAKYDCRSNIQRIREFKVQAMFKNKVVGNPVEGDTQKEKCVSIKKSWLGK